MSDHDVDSDPIDRAYAEAEAMLNDEAARAARRAKVLAAVVGEPVAAPSPTERRPVWQSRGWLAAASIVGVGVLVATQLYQPPRNPAPLAGSPASAPKLSVIPAPPQPALRKPPAPPLVRALPNEVPASVTPPLVLPPPPQAFPSVTPAAPAPAPPPPAPPPPPPPPPAEADAGVTESVVVTAAKRAEAAPRPTPPAGDPAAILRQAAAMGRTGDIKALLAKGAPVDAPDDSGVTALMRAVQADQPAAAALLVRHGADPDHRNAAGDSARDLAAMLDDPALVKALRP